MANAPDVKRHPNQESKSGRAPYASPVKRNASTNDPRQASVVGGVEDKMRREITRTRKKNKNGKGTPRRERGSNTDR